MTPRSAGMVLAVAVAAVSWAAILVRVAQPTPPGVIALYRVGFASLILLPFALRSRGAAARGEAGAVPRLRIVLAGLLLGAHFLAWFASLELTGVASSVLLVQTQPIFAGVLAPLLLGESTGRATWLAIGLAAAGTVIVTAADLGISSTGKAPLLGDLLALLAAVCAVLYFIVGRSVRTRLPLVPYLVGVNGVAAASMLVWVVVAGEPLVGYPARVWMVFLLLALGPSLLGHGLLNLAVRHLRAQTVNLALIGEPILATVYAALLLAERPPALFYPGAALVAAGLVVASRGRALR